MDDCHVDQAISKTVQRFIQENSCFNGFLIDFVTFSPSDVIYET